MSTVETLRRILELERAKGYEDTAVIGGLQAYLKGCTSELSRIVTDSRLVGFQELQASGGAYAKWDRERRREWAQELMAFLDRLEEGMSGGIERTDGNLRPLAARAHSQPIRSRGKTGQRFLEIPIDTINGVGVGMVGRLGKLGIRTIRDLLYFFPRRHLDYSQSRPIRDLVVGEEQTIIANVWEALVASFGGRKGTEAVIGDETGNIRVAWFNQPYLAKRLTVNARVVLSGRVNVYRGQRVLESPEWELLEDRELVHTGRLVPLYALTQGLHPRQMRKLMKTVVDTWAWQVKDFLPQDVKQRSCLLDLPQALSQAHFPDSAELKDLARERLAFDELFLLQLGVLDRKKDWQEEPGHPLALKSGAVQRFVQLLPFALTSAQQKAMGEILEDVVMTRPMSRLLQGDVGSGKTVVATAALVAAVDNGYQGALMAPTQILAEQHFRTISQLLPSDAVLAEDDLYRLSGVLSSPVTVALLTGNTREKRKGELYSRITKGEIDIVIGTHALIQKEVEFKNLALVVVDEQHRFGVMQRLALRQKGFNPHMLVMTATPIPRTLALTLYGDLDISTIGELPPGRQQVKTRWLTPERRDRAYEFVRQQVGECRQVFVICPLIEESEAIQVKAATSEYERLSRDVFPDLRLDLLHGRMAGMEKDDVMQRFRARELDILVSTSVVEVGIDVPNATVMLVEGADRFGLSQLHQFRGRVGRGDAQGYCLLLAEQPSPEGRERLLLIERTYDGFVLAEEDLRLRGPGEFFGTRQSGMPDLNMAKLTDIAILERAREEATELFRNDPELEAVEHRALSKEVARIWRQGGERS